MRPFAGATGGVRDFFANFLSLHFLKLAHKRAAPLRLLIGTVVGAIWLVFGLLTATENAGAFMRGAPITTPNEPAPPPVSAIDRTVQGFAHGVCVLRDGKACDFKNTSDTRIYASQTAFTLLALITLFFGFWRSLFEAFAKAFRWIGAGHVIVTGEGPDAEALARAIVRKSKVKRRAAILIRRTGSTAEIEALGADGVNLVVGSPKDKNVLNAAGAKSAYRIIALSASDAENLAVAAAARDARRHYSAGDIAVRLESPDLRHDLPSHGEFGAADLFSLPEISARLITRSSLLLDDVEARSSARGVHAAILGWDENGMAIAERVFRMMWAMDLEAPKVSVFTPDPKAAEAQFMARFPHAFHDPGTPPGRSPIWTADIAFISYQWRLHANPWEPLAETENYRGAITSAFVSCPTDQETLHCAAVLAGRASNGYPRIYVRDDKDGTIGAVLSAYPEKRVLPFAEQAAILSPDALVNRSLDDAARRAHEAYFEDCVLAQNPDEYEIALRKGDGFVQGVRRLLHRAPENATVEQIQSDFDKAFGHKELAKLRTNLTQRLLAAGRFEKRSPAQCPWDELTEEYIETNRIAADHSVIKLRCLGWIPAKRGETPKIDAKQVSDKAAEIEHLRWAADKLLAGWSYGHNRSDEKHVHPDLLSYADFDPARLPDAIRKDRAMWLDAPKVASWIHPTLFKRRQTNAASK